jgi:hypothetical protein
MRRSLVVAAIALLIVPVTALSAPAWTLGEVSGADQNSPVSSLVISPTNASPSVAWAQEGGDDLWWGRWNGSSWVKTQLAGRGTFGACYYDELIGNVALGPAAGFTPGGGARVVAPCWPTGSSSTITWYRLVGGSWKKSVITGLFSDGDGSCPAHGSVDLAFDPDDAEASIVIGRSGGTNSKLVYWIHHLPAGWQKEQVYTGPGPCLDAPLPSLAFNPVSGEPGVALNTTTSGAGNLVFTERSGGDWSSVDEPIETASVVGVPSIGYTPDGTPWIAYQLQTKTGNLLRVAHFDGVWQTEDVDTTSADTGYTPSLAINPAGLVRVAYHDQSTGDLRLAKRDAGGTWTLSTIESTGDVGEYPSLVFTASGKTRISYYKVTGKSIRWARS